MSRIEYVPNMRGYWYGNTVGIFKEVRTQDIGDKIKVAEVQGIVDSLNKIISSHLGLAPALVFLPKVVMLVGVTILLVGLLNEEQAQLSRLAPVGVVVLSLGFLANIYIKHAIRNTEIVCRKEIENYLAGLNVEYGKKGVKFSALDTYIQVGILSGERTYSKRRNSAASITLKTVLPTIDLAVEGVLTSGLNSTKNISIDPVHSTNRV